MNKILELKIKPDPIEPKSVHGADIWLILSFLIGLAFSICSLYINDWWIYKPRAIKAEKELIKTYDMLKECIDLNSFEGEEMSYKSFFNNTNDYDPKYDD